MNYSAIGKISQSLLKNIKQVHLLHFQNLRRKIKSENNKAYNAYILEKQERYNPKLFWSF